MNRQLTLFGDDIAITTIGEYYVFHDESMPLPNKRWLLIGLNFVKKKDYENACLSLRYWKEKEGYNREIHFYKLPKSFGGEFGAKARVAKRWLLEFEGSLKEILCFICLIVNRQNINKTKFATEFHEYNRFTVMALKAGIAWFIGNQFNEVKIKFISDKKERTTTPKRGFIDNFEEYIPQRAEIDAFLQQLSNKKYPNKVYVDLELKDSAEEELIQFTDVMLGAIQTALTGNARRRTKRELASLILNWIRNLQSDNWEKKNKFFKKFSIWGFPNKKGAPYDNVHFALQSNNTIKF